MGAASNGLWSLVIRTGGGVAPSVAALAPERVEALVLLASVGPGCLNGWDRLLAAPVTGEVS